jgi:predicted O-methyltransferase YrrM
MQHTITFLLFMSFISYIPITGKQKNLPEPYSSVNLLPYVSGGHFGERQASGLKHVITLYQPKIVVEIGSYLGASTRFIANLLPEHGVVYAVDHWRGNSEWFNKPGYQERQATFYQQFLSNVIHQNLCHKIIPMKMSSLEAAKVLEVVPDMIFIDGSHDYQSVYNDLTAWYEHIKGHGVLCGDDYHWGTGKPVKQAVDQFAKEHRLTIKLIQNWFWYYEKK